MSLLNNELKVKIPWWYKPFIKGMPDFWAMLPLEEEGFWTTDVYIVPFSFVGTKYEKGKKGMYTSKQKAYLRARWRVYWADKFDPTDRGIVWVVEKAFKKINIQDHYEY